MGKDTKITTLIQVVMDSFSNSDFNKTTIEYYRWIYSRFLKYCDDNKITHYSESIGEQFITFLKIENSEIRSAQLSVFKRCINRLNCAFKGNEWEPLRRPCGEYVQSCFNYVVIEYEKYLMRSGKTHRLIRSYTLPVSKFLRDIEQLGYTDLKLLSNEAILKAFEFATNKRTFHEIIGMFLKYIFERGLTKTNLRLIIPAVIRHQSVPSVYSLEEVEILLNSVDRTVTLGKRNYAIILIAARLGLRASDIANLRFENLRMNNNTIVIKQVKTRNPLTTIFLPDVKEAIFDYVNNARPQSNDDHIFLNAGGYGFMNSASVTWVVQFAFEKSGIELSNRRHGAHALRASLATALLHEGNSYHTIQQVLGHTSINSTKVYVRADIEKLRTNAIPVPLPSGNFEYLLQKGGAV